MKKCIMKLSLLLTVLGFLFTSCTKKDETNTPPAPETVTASVTYTLPARHDLLEIFDMTVYYTNSEGKEVSEKVTVTPWKKTITKVAVPSVCVLKVVCVRNNKPLSKAAYNIGKGLFISYITTAGTMRETGSEQLLSGVKGSDVEKLKLDEEDKMDIAASTKNE